jgi:GT2 family glycosyltransferase
MNVPTSATVIICAYTQDRWAELTESIESVIAQPEVSEIIVVIDHESELLERVRTRWPRLTVVPNEQRRGLSGARNTGLELVSDDIVAFLDDDAAATAGWLASLLNAFRDPTVVAVGGTALPNWPAGRAPSVLPPELLWVVGCSYRGQPTRRADVRNVIGCSMAFRSSALRRIDGFNVATGRVGRLPLGAEETEACIRLHRLETTSRILLEPSSVVRHTVTPERTTWRYLRRRCFYEGVSKAVLAKTLGAGDALESERGYLLRTLTGGIVRAILRGHPLAAVAILLAVVSAGSGFAWGSMRTRAGVAPLRPSGRAVLR